VILLSEMGSLVLAHGMFRTLRERYPGASLYLLTFKRNRQILETLQVVPSENIMAVDGESLCKLAPQSLAALAKLRRRGMDISLDCELFSRVSSILGFLSGASVRAGFHPFTQEGLYRGKLINLPVQYNPYRHISKQFVTLAAALESRQVPPAKRALAEGSVGLPPMNLDRRELASFRRRLCSDFPIIREKRLVLLYPGGGLLPIRAWPLSYFVRVAHELTGRGYAVGVIGTREDRPLAEEIAGACANDACVNLTGYTQTVRELMLLFHLAALLITNDGGPGHFASLTPIPAILLFGPETPVLYGSLAPNAVNLCSSFSCSPCLTAYNHRNSPCNGDNQCLKSISPEEVLSKAHEILDNIVDGEA
jgi:ADP-heptose:LPS heptosyltransferase